MSMNNRLLRPRASRFNPKSIAGLYAWFDASQAASVTLNGSTVSEWRDLSGAGRHLSNATASAQPTYTTAGQNGKNCLTFSASGAGKRLVAAAAADWSFLHDGTSLWSIFLVASSTGTSGVGQVHTYLSTRGTYSGYTTRGFDMTHDYGGLAANNNIRTTISSSSAMVARRDMSATGLGVVRCFRISGDPANATSTARLAFTHTASGTSSATSSAASAEAGSPTAALTVGNPASGSAFPLGGTICELLMWSAASAITEVQASAINNYLTKKWGV